MFPPAQSVYFPKPNNEKKRNLVKTPKNGKFFQLEYPIVPKQLIQQIYGDDQLFLTEIRSDRKISNDSDELINKVHPNHNYLKKKLYQSMRSFSSLKSKGFHSSFYKSKMTRDKTELSDQDENDLSIRKSSSVNSRRSNLFRNKDTYDIERQLFHDMKAYNQLQNLCQQKEEQIRSLKELIQQMETDHEFYQQIQADDIEERTQLISQIQQAEFDVKILLQENKGIRQMRRDRMNDNEIRSLPFKQDSNLYEKMKQILRNYRNDLQETNQNINIMRCKYIEIASKMENTKLVLKDHREDEIEHSERLAKTYYDQWKNQTKSPVRSKVQSFQKTRSTQKLDKFDKDLADVKAKMAPYYEVIRELKLTFDQINIVLEEPQQPQKIVDYLQKLKQAHTNMQDHLKIADQNIIEIRAQNQELENDIQVLMFEQQMQESERFEQILNQWKLLGLKSDRNIEGDVEELLENIQEKVTIYSHELVLMEKCCIKAVQGINSIQRQFQSYFSMTTRTPYILFTPGHYKSDPKTIIQQLNQLIEKFENSQSVKNNFQLKQKNTH